MFDTYADTITLPGAVDQEFYGQLAPHINRPNGPVHVTGGPGTGKVHAIAEMARVCDCTFFEVDTTRAST